MHTSTESYISTPANLFTNSTSLLGLLVDDFCTARIQLNILDILGQVSKCTLTEEKINLLEGQLLRLLEEDNDDWQRDADVPGDEHEVELPSNGSETNGRHLTPDGRNEPVTNSSGKGTAARSDLHGHDLGGVCPTNWTEREAENASDEEDEENTANGQSVLLAARVLRVENGLADKRQCDCSASENQWLLPSKTVREERDEDEVANRTDTVVDSGNEQVSGTLDSKALVHDCLVVVDDIDTGHLSEDLDHRGMHKTSSPLRYSEHDTPARCSDRFLGSDGSLDLVELLVDPIVVPAVVVQLAEHTHGLVLAVRLQKMSGRFGKERHTNHEHHAWKRLECKGKSPRERTGCWDMMTPVTDPGGDDETNADHLLCNTDNQA